jgi:hypothetical protein
LAVWLDNRTSGRPTAKSVTLLRHLPAGKVPGTNPGVVVVLVRVIRDATRR